MRSLTSEDHVVWDCQYHVVIVPKYRKKVLYGPVRVQIGKIIRELAKQKEIEVLEGNACPEVGVNEETIRKYVQDQWKNDQFFDGDQLDLHWN